MEVSGTTSPLAQEVAASKPRAGFDVLTKTLAKSDQVQQSEQERTSIAEQTGKGLNIDIKA